MEEYDVEISDLDDPKITKGQVVKEINEVIRRDMKLARTLKGIEIDVQPEWYDMLLEDGSIIRSYEKAGWKVRWWEQHEDGPATGKLLRSWLCIQDAQFIPVSYTHLRAHET